MVQLVLDVLNPILHWYSESALGLAEWSVLDWNADAILSDEFLFVGGAGPKAEAFFVSKFVEGSVFDGAELGPGDETGLYVLAAVADDIEEGFVDIGDLVELAGNDAGDGGLGDLDKAAGALAAELFVEVVAFGEVANDAGEAAEYAVLVLEGHGDAIGPEEGRVRAAVEALGGDVTGGAGVPEVLIETIGESGFLLIEHRHMTPDGLFGRVSVAAFGAGIPGDDDAGLIEEEESVILDPGRNTVGLG